MALYLYYSKLKVGSKYLYLTILWRSCKQTMLTKSTTEVELVALETATNEVEWLRELLMNLPFVDKSVPPILMYCDNQSMLAQVMNIKDNSKSNKHIKHRLKSIKKIKKKLWSDSCELCEN
jgi:hypothetical protein